MRSKYSNIKCFCKQAHKHDSKFEASYCDKLELLQKAGEIERYEVQITFPMEVKGHHICNHIVDFLVIPKFFPGVCVGYTEVHDTKGVRTAVFNLKHKLFKALYPQIEYKIITKGGTKCSKGIRGSKKGIQLSQKKLSKKQRSELRGIKS